MSVGEIVSLVEPPQPVFVATRRQSAFFHVLENGYSSLLLMENCTPAPADVVRDIDKVPLCVILPMGIAGPTQRPLFHIIILS